MAKGLPDFFQYETDTDRSRSISLSEVAARLGSVDLLDRRGETAWIDSFEHGLVRWSIVKGVATCTADISTSWTEHGGYSAHLLIPDGSNTFVRLDHPEPIRTYRPWGLSVRWQPIDEILSVDTEFLVKDGSRITRFGARYSQENDQIEYLASTGTYTDTGAGSPELFLDPALGWMKLVIDPANLTYKRILFGSTEITFTTETGPDEGASLTQTVTQIVRVRADAVGLDQGAYIDSVVFTVNEP